MSNRTLRNNFKDLIIITKADGTQIELWGLVVAARDKRQQYQLDADYIPTLRKQLKSTDPKKVAEAQEALIFLNAAVMAELDTNFKWLEELGISVSNEFKKEAHDSKNSAKRDFVNNNQGAQTNINVAHDSSHVFIDPIDQIDPSTSSTIGEMVDHMRATKKALRKQGKSVSDLHKPKTKKADKVTSALPVKKLSADELDKFQKEYFKTKTKE